MNKFLKNVSLVVSLFGMTYSLSAQNTETQYLSGKGTDDAVMWDFYCTAGNNSGKWTQIPVPSNWEFHGFGQFTYGHDKDRINETGMYRHKFTVPKDWKGKKINIVFDGSMTDTEVFVNGKKAGPMHQGAFYCFRYDITKLLKYGNENLLEVTVHKSSSNASVENAERESDFWVFGGIFRPVWLEALPQSNIERIAIDAKCDGKFRMNVFLGKKEPNAEVVAQVKTLDGKPYGKEIRLNVRNQDSVCLSSEFSNPALWSSEFPNRYKVEVSLLKGNKVQHCITEKFGFRTVELRPRDGFYVNGVRIKFKGVNHHTHWPTSGRASNYDLSLKDVLLIKEMNMNAVRMSHYPPDRHFLEVCDSLGLYVMDELTGWQSAYDTPIGREKVRELVTRDVNHPCIVIWSNGNEGGFNFNLLPDYARYDIQKRAVCHPWLEQEDLNTAHYPSYGIGTHFLFQGNKVFFPTECIHGLYDGGHGAGLDDYWKLMQDNPLSAGCFLWDFADQGVVRNDKGNIIDTDKNHGADGILGPYREKEGSFYTIKEIWCPVYLEGTSFIPSTFDGTLKVQNRYHFTNLNQCSFKAEWVKFDYKKGAAEKLETKVLVPDVQPGLSGYLKIELPSDIRQYDALFLTATDLYGKNLYTWTRPITSAQDYAPRLVSADHQANVVQEEQGDNTVLKADKTEVIVDKSTGTIKSISVDGKILSLNNGPRFTTDTLQIFDTKKIENGMQFMYRPKGNTRPRSRNNVQISLLPSGWTKIEYTFDVGGYYDYIGVTFDYPESKVKKIKWLGNGPYRVWKNRLKGTTFNIWEKNYNNTVTGESWDYPEFKGYHSNLYAADLQTEEGTVQIVTASEDLYLHLFTPDPPKGRYNDNTVGRFPNGQLSILNAISPIGTKFKRPKDLGPQGQQNYYHQSGSAYPLSGVFYIRYIPE